MGQVTVDVTAPGKPDEMNYKELLGKDEAAEHESGNVDFGPLALFVLT